MKHGRLACLVLALVAVNIGGRAESDTIDPTLQLRAIVDGHYYEISESRVDEAMSYYHSRSPQAEQGRESIEYGVTQFRQFATILEFNVVRSDEHIALARARHRILRIIGIKYLEKVADRLYTFRRERGAWKLWSVEPMDR